MQYFVLCLSWRFFISPSVFFLRFYLFDRERQSARGGTQVGGVGEEEAGSEEPDMGLDPRTPGSHPEPKADA